MASNAKAIYYRAFYNLGGRLGDIPPGSNPDRQRSFYDRKCLSAASVIGKFSAIRLQAVWSHKHLAWILFRSRGLAVTRRGRAGVLGDTTASTDINDVSITLSTLRFAKLFTFGLPNAGGSLLLSGGDQNVNKKCLNWLHQGLIAAYCHWRSLPQGVAMAPCAN